MRTAEAPKGMNPQDAVSAVAKGEHRGHTIYRAEQAGGCPNRRSDELVTWYAVKDGAVVTVNDTRKHLVRVLDLMLDMTDEQRAMRDRIAAELTATR